MEKSRRLQNRYRIGVISWLILMISGLLFVTACSDSNQNTQTSLTHEEESLSGTITESGSSTIQPLAEKLAAAYTLINPNVKVIIQGGGSSVGIKAAKDGTVDIGAASRELTQNDPILGKHLLARDGIAIIVNPANPVQNLSKDQIKDIYTGKIIRWNQIEGQDREIHVAAREEGSGTRTAFEEMVMGKDAFITKRAILQSSNGALMQVIKSDPDAIGFVSFGYLIDQSIKALNVNGIPASEEKAQSGEYPIVRPLYFLTRNQPEGLIKSFIDFCAGPDAQTIVRQEGYIAVN